MPAVGHAVAARLAAVASETSCMTPISWPLRRQGDVELAVAGHGLRNLGGGIG